MEYKYVSFKGIGYICYPFGLKISEAINPNIIADETPELVNSNIPVRTPIGPLLSNSTRAPFKREFPKLQIGTVAPAPANLIRGSYNPNPPNIAPATTRVLIV